MNHRKDVLEAMKKRAPPIYLDSEEVRMAKFRINSGMNEVSENYANKIVYSQADNEEIYII